MKRVFCLALVFVLLFPVVVFSSLGDPPVGGPYYWRYYAYNNGDPSRFNVRVIYYDDLPTYDNRLIRTVDRGQVVGVRHANGISSCAVHYYFTSNDTKYTVFDSFISFSGGYNSNWTVVFTTNMPMYDNDNGNIVYPSDYYIDDTIGCLTDNDINNLHNIEAKFEQNLQMQFFVSTSKSDVSWQNVRDSGALKSPSGRGSLYIWYSQDKHCYAIGISSMFARHYKYENPHNRIAYDFKFYTDTYPLNYALQKFLLDVYNNVIYAEKEGNSNLLTADMCKLHKFYDRDSFNWILVNSKLPDPYNIIIPGVRDSFVDRYAFTDVDVDQYHIWFVSTLYVPVSSATPSVSATVVPTVTPTLYPSVTPINSLPPSYNVPIIEPPAPDDDDMKSITDDVYKKMDYGQLKGGLDKISGLHETNSAPVIKLNLNQMVSGVCDNFHFSNPFPSGHEYTIFDLSTIDEYKFSGVPIRLWFKGLISAYMIYLTVMALWKKIFPEESLS